MSESDSDETTREATKLDSTGTDGTGTDGTGTDSTATDGAATDSTEKNSDAVLLDRANKAARLLRARRAQLSREREEKSGTLSALVRGLKLLQLKPRMEQKEMSDLLGVRLHELDALLAEAEKKDLVARIEPDEPDMRRVIVFAEADAVERAEAEQRKGEALVPELSAEELKQLLDLLSKVIDPLAAMGLDEPHDERGAHGGHDEHGRRDEHGSRGDVRPRDDRKGGSGGYRGNQRDDDRRGGYRGGSGGYRGGSGGYRGANHGASSSSYGQRDGRGGYRGGSGGYRGGRDERGGGHGGYRGSSSGGSGGYHGGHTER